MPKTKQDAPSGHAMAQRSYHQRQLDKGLVRLSVYVPDEDRAAFWDAIDTLRARWYKLGLMD